MAVLRGSIFSEVLYMDTDITIITPRKPKDATGNNKVIYPLHGLSENNGSWSNNLGLIISSQKYNITYIIPEVQRSFYTDMMYGLRYYTYIAEELPLIIEGLFNISAKREDTFVFGLSMGGYGALKCAFKNPERFSCCAAFSPACDIKGIFNQYIDSDKALSSELKAGFGINGELLEENDLYMLAKSCSKKAIKPVILMTCGTEDWLQEMSEDFYAYAKNLDLDIEYKQWEGEHNWEFWSESLQVAIDKFIKE